MLSHWIWLSIRKNVSPQMAFHLIQSFPDLESLYYARDYSYMGVTEEAEAALLDKDLTAAEMILEDCAQRNIQIVTYADGAYPNRLRNIKDPPTVLYYRGRLPDLDAEAAIGVVGTRRASAYGLKMAKQLGLEITRCGGIVVSGMAEGVDSAAMEGSLMGEGTPVAVLGCGPDVIYPRGQRELYEDTVFRGCVLSEYPPGTPPEAWHFPMRNRIISGISNGILVVEAPIKSGALITAEAALEQGKDIFAVPCNVGTPSGAGSNALLRAGAILVRDGWDIMENYEGMYPEKVSLCEECLRAYRPEINIKTLPKHQHKSKDVFETPEKSVDNGDRTSYDDDQRPMLSEQETVLWDLLSTEPRHVDQLIAQCDLPAAQILSMLTVLELKGCITRHPGKYYSRTPVRHRER